MPGLDELRAEVERRLGTERLAHVAAVAETCAGIASAGKWPPPVAEGALRAAWIHDAWKEDPPAAWRDVMRSAGWEPDPWSVRHAPHLLHAEAAAAWAQARGEADPEVIAAVRHHPTGHPGWGPVGRILFVSDFCEPTRSFAEALETASLRARAGEGTEGLAEAARRVLALRLRRLLDKERPAHPRSWETWNAWTGAVGP